MPLIPLFKRQKQANLCEFKDSLGYIVSPGHPGLYIKTTKLDVVVVQAFNPSIVDDHEVKASLVYSVNSKIAKAT